jgi:hypothetical protein
MRTRALMLGLALVFLAASCATKDGQKGSDAKAQLEKEKAEPVGEKEDPTKPAPEAGPASDGNSTAPAEQLVISDDSPAGEEDPGELAELEEPPDDLGDKELANQIEEKFEEAAPAAEARADHAKALNSMVASKTVTGVLGSDFGVGSERLRRGSDNAGSGGFGEGAMAAGGPGSMFASDDDGGFADERRYKLNLGKADKKGTEKKKVETWKRSELVPNTSKLTVGDKEELPLKGMEVTVDVSGFRARVVMDFYFHNKDRQQYEGTFKLRLPDKATPYFFAFGQTARGFNLGSDGKPVFAPRDAAQKRGLSPLRIMADRRDSWQAPKEARMVPKEKAAHAYTETVRRRVDPALMEWSGAGVFNSRVFPIAPNSLNRVVIAYDVDLTPLGEDLGYTFDIPQEIPDLVVNLGVKLMDGVSTTVAPKATPVETSTTAFYRFENPKEKSISVRLDSPGPLLLTGTDEEVGPLFAARFAPDVSAAAASGTSTAVLLVDVSLSSNPDQFNVWLKLLRTMLDSNREQIGRFAVLFFNVEGFWFKEQFVDNTPKNVAALMAFAESLALEGATDLGAALHQASNPDWLSQGTDPSKWDLFLLSDGAITWGEGDLYALTSGLAGSHAQSVFAYRSGIQGTDSRVLEHLTRQSGGSVFSVVGEAELAKAAVAHRFRPWMIEGLEVAGGSDLLLAGRPKSLFPGQSLVLVGRGTPAKGAEVILKLRQGDTQKDFRIALEKTLESKLTPRTYGYVATNQLEEFQSETEEVAVAYARHFRITGQTCSLLMLESEADYLRFGIKPEEDALVVKTSRAAVMVAEVLMKAQKTLGDAKATFLAWLEKMEKMPHIGLQVPTALKMTLKRLPREKFTVVPKPLRCGAHDWKSLPTDIREQLGSKTIDYDALSAEAEKRLKKHGAADALKALSSLVENSPGDAVLARDVGFSAMELGLGGQAYHLLRRVAASRPHEPQTYRAMALCLAEMGVAELATVYFELSLAGKWNSRYGEFRRIVGMDYLRFLKRESTSKEDNVIKDFAEARLKTLSAELAVEKADLVVTLTWNTDSTDVDLHVIEPTGEECYYGHRETRLGGNLSVDVTQGYGPEMYILKDAGTGDYKIRAKYFAANRNRATTRTKVYATIYRNWGSPDEHVTRKVISLGDNKEMHDLASVTVKR